LCAVLFECFAAGFLAVLFFAFDFDDFALADFALADFALADFALEDFEDLALLDFVPIRPALTCV
jgi:hypothetical protein